MGCSDDSRLPCWLDGLGVFRAGPDTQVDWQRGLARVLGWARSARVVEYCLLKHGAL
jgi:hypothetical protein